MNKILILIVCILASILTYVIFKNKSSTCSGDKPCPQSKSSPECPQTKPCPECPQTKPCPICPQTKSCPICQTCPSFPPANFLGVKGKWNQDFKDTQNLEPGNKVCSDCLLLNSESMLTPYEYLTANDDTKKMVYKKCTIECPPL